MSPRQQVNSAPMKLVALQNPLMVERSMPRSTNRSIPVIDGNRNWVGEPITVDLVSGSSIPSDLLDGDNDTQLNESEVENFVVNDGLSLHEDTTLNGEVSLHWEWIQIHLLISCSDNDVPKWDVVVEKWDCVFDNDTLADQTASVELAKFDGVIGYVVYRLIIQAFPICLLIYNPLQNYNVPRKAMYSIQTMAGYVTAVKIRQAP